MHGQLPLEIEVAYSSGEQVPLVGERFGQELVKYSNYFNKKFEETFSLKAKVSVYVWLLLVTVWLLLVTVWLLLVTLGFF